MRHLRSTTTANVLCVLLILCLGTGCATLATPPSPETLAPVAPTEVLATPRADMDGADAITAASDVTFAVEELTFAGNGDTFLERIEAARAELEGITHHRYVTLTDDSGAVWQGELLVHGGGATAFLQPQQSGGESGLRLDAASVADDENALLAAMAARLPAAAQPAPTPDVVIEFVRARQTGDGEWSFDVTLNHPDTGWEDYTDGWHVETPDGEILATRILLHPHVNEMPFTRGLSRVSMPADVESVQIRAHDLISGYDPDVLRVPLAETGSGERYEVTR
jgi:hypothetical protein